MHRTACSAILGAVAIATAFGLCGCGASKQHPAASIDGQTSTTASVTAPAPDVAPLPPPEALTDVLTKLADPDVPGADKVTLVEFAKPDEAATLDSFGRALRDSGFAPLAFEARDLKWSQNTPGNVLASISVKAANPKSGDFTFPMEFTPSAGSWQLTRQTADMLLQLGQETAATPTP